MTKEAERWRARVTQTVRFGDDYMLLELEPEEAFPARAGQYTILWLRDDAGELPLYYSLASAPGHRVQLIVQKSRHDRIERFLAGLKKDSPCWLGPPKTILFDSSLVVPHTTFIAGGSGIAPMRALLMDQLLNKKDGSPLTLIYGCRDGATMPFAAELLEWSQTFPFFRLVRVSEQRREGFQPGFVTDHLPPLNKAKPYFICGPKPMVAAVKARLLEGGVPESLILIESH